MCRNDRGRVETCTRRLRRHYRQKGREDIIPRSECGWVFSFRGQHHQKRLYGRIWTRDSHNRLVCGPCTYAFAKLLVPKKILVWLVLLR